MNSSCMISRYEINLYKYNTIYSAGPNVFFCNPCIGYVKKGYAKFLYKGKIMYAHKGDLIYIASETAYSSIWYGSPDIEWYSVSFDFKSKYAYRDYNFQILKNYPEDIFAKMYQCHNDSPMLSLAYFYMLLDDLYKKLETSFNNNLFSNIIPGVEYIEDNYKSPISVKTLANICRCSESGFFKQFKKATGVTPVAYKHNLMIQHAIDLLINTTMSIEEISNQAGFSSSNYFRKVFIKLTEKTPKELRKNI